MPLAEDATLRERGWDEPLDSSPVDPPEGWYRGAIMHTGGGIYCRIWRTVETISVPPREDDPGVYFQVGYNSDFTGASLERYEYVSETENWEYAGTVEHREADEQSDAACAALAVELMQSVDPMNPTTACN